MENEIKPAKILLNTMSFFVGIVLDEKIITEFQEQGLYKNFGYKNFSKDVTQVFNAILKIPPRNIYIKIEDITAFGVGGELFDEVH